MHLTFISPVFYHRTTSFSISKVTPADQPSSLLLAGVLEGLDGHGERALAGLVAADEAGGVDEDAVGDAGDLGEVVVPEGEPVGVELEPRLEHMVLDAHGGDAVGACV